MDMNLGNKELIDRYETLGLEINKTFMELVSRYMSRELTEEEWDYICDIGSRRGSELVDYCNVSKKGLRKGLSQLADILLDENR